MSGFKDSAGRFVRWRRESGGWAYSLLAASWAAMTVVLASATGWGWIVYLASAALFLLLFEVGLAYIVSAAWGSHRQIEYEGFIFRLVTLYKVGLDDDAVCEELSLSAEDLQRLKAQLTAPENNDQGEHHD